MPQYSLYVKKANDPTVFAVTADGKFVAMESWSDLLASNGGTAPQIQTRGDELQIPAGTLTSSGKPYEGAQQATAPAPAPTATAPAPAPQQATEAPQEAAPTGVTGNAQLDDLLGQYQTYLDNLISQGQTVNPNIEITPDVLKGFLDQAGTEISPYYQEQAKIIKDDVSRSLDGLTKRYELEKQSSEANFKANLAQSREVAAGAGRAQSGFRFQDEANQAAGAQRSLDFMGLGYGEQAGNTLRTAERTLGTAGLGMTAPTLSTPTVSTAGTGGFTGSRTMDFYSPSNISGSLQREQMTAEQLRANELEQTYRYNRTLNFA